MTGTKKATSIRQDRIAVLSDGTAETAEGVVRALLALFDITNPRILRLPQIKTEKDLHRAIEGLDPPYLLCYTFASEKLRKAAWTDIRSQSLVGIDLLYPAIEVFSKFLEDKPREQEGVLRSIDNVEYFERISAIEFTVKHDDGMRMHELGEADAILVGVSRSSKTPTAMYLAHKGYKVANVPLVPGIEPSSELFEASKMGIPIVCLSISAVELQRIRHSRFAVLGADSKKGDQYVDAETIRDELRYARDLAKRNNWKFIDATNKAIEETATEILLLIRANKR